jgi:hypothetical protein
MIIKHKANFISVSDFRKLHPDGVTSDSDIYFTSLANKILRAFNQEPFSSQDIDPDWLKTFTIRSVAYFEDVISHFGLFAGLRKIHLKMFGKKLPFYTLGKEYIDEEINVEDIQFIVWSTIQEAVNESKRNSLINPENVLIELTSQTIFIILDEEYETAPENEEIYHLLHKYQFDNFYTFRMILKWLYYNSYLSMHYPLFNLETNKKKISEFSSKKLKTIYNQLIYFAEANLTVTGACSPFAIKAIDWFKEITTNRQILKKIKKFDFRPYSIFKIIDGNDNIVNISSFGANPEMFELSRDSTDALNKNDISEYEYGKKVIQAALVYFDGLWHVNGFASVMDMSDKILKQENDRLKKEKMHHESSLYTHDIISKHTKNKPVAFFETSDEVQNFLIKIFPDASNIEEFITKSKLKNERNLILFTTARTGMAIFPDLAEIIKISGNNFYNKETAADCGLALLAGDYALPLEFMEYIINNNYIPEAKTNSLKGVKHGRKLVQDNKWFIFRFFQPNSFGSAFINALPFYYDNMN